MKPSKLLRSLLLAAGSSLLAVSSASAQTTYTWDIDAAAGVTGGTGAWNTTNTLWTTDAGATNTSWVNAGAAPFNNAIFGGTTGTVTLGEAISIRNLNFTNTAGAYTITGSTLNFTGGTITGPVSSATESAIIQSNITGAPAINLQPMAGDRQFTLRPAASGSMVIGAVTGDAGNNSEKINLQGGAGSTGTIASVTGPKVIVTGGSWTINGASTGRNHDILGGTLTLNAGLTATLRAVILGSTGTLNYNVASAVSATAATAISGDNGFRITGGTLDNTRGAAINTNASTQSIDLAGTLTFAGSNGANSNLHLGSGAVFLKAGNRQITVTNSATTLTIGGVFQNDSTPGRGLTKAGAGTLRLSGTGSTYTGVTTITAGTLSVAAVGNGGAAGSLGQATSAAGNIVFNGGTLRYTGANATSDRAFTINTGITATIETANNISFAGATGAATNGALTKTGAGALTLTGVNTYTGLTTVSNGSLIVNGNISTSISTTVASGATLGGTGTVGATTISGTHSPGTSPGISSHSSLTYEAGANVIWELVANSTANRGSDFDGINVTGALTFSGATTLDLNFNFGASAVEWQNAFWDNDYTGIGGWLIYSGATSLTGFSNLGLNSPTAWLDESGDALATIRSDASFSLFQDGNIIYLNYTVIPEPSTALLGGLGMLLLLRRRRA